MGENLDRTVAKFDQMVEQPRAGLFRRGHLTVGS
jgi:hypothetical protein